ncbi:MAG: hypothetical protein ACT6UH_07065 [Hydrogenophaga sp.]|uniref:hypothetical protein n=1 Tax=Hydrogenophaga sp. TaxID=1904254 RepID=UPI0040365301
MQKGLRFWLWVLLFLGATTHLRANAEATCFSLYSWGDVSFPAEWALTPQQKLQHEFFDGYRAYRGDPSMAEFLYASFGAIPLRCDPPARGQYTRCEYWGGSTSSGVLYNVPEPYSYRVEVRELRALNTLCDAKGVCKQSDDPNAYAACVTPTYMPYTVTLVGTHDTVDKELTPIDLTAQVSLDGRPITQHPVKVQLSDNGQHGGLLCGAGCNHWRTDSNGRLLLQYVPKQRSNTPITFTATCTDCSNSGRWTVKSRKEVVIGFFNGVANTREAAQKSIDRLEVEFGSQHNEAPLKYDWFYNQTACGEGVMGKPSCLEDVAEVFEQRSRELGGVFADRWETFWDILTGRHQHDTSTTGRLLHLLGTGGNALLQWLDATASAALNQLTASTLKLLTLFTQSPTYENRAAHLERLLRYADEGASLLLVAHSQGNLFVNNAHDAIRAARPNVAAQVVHVAPASPTLRGDYVLASIDLVINGLRLTGANSVPPANITIPPRLRDATGHGFEPTYLDTARAAYARTRGLIVQSLDTLIH